MADNKQVEVRVKVLAYWIDYETNKAYCAVQYIDMNQDEKHTNIFLIESKYTGK